MNVGMIFVGELLLGLGDTLQPFVEAFGQVIRVERTSCGFGEAVEREKVRLTL